MSSYKSERLTPQKKKGQNTWTVAQMHNTSNLTLRDGHIKISPYHSIYQIGRDQEADTRWHTAHGFSLKNSVGLNFKWMYSLYQFYF